jgi:hypothetical protein
MSFGLFRPPSVRESANLLPKTTWRPREYKNLDCQSKAEARMVQARDQELAAARHAILNAARIGNNIGRERLQVECEALDSWKRLITTLFQTPLSMAQRGVLAEVVCALDGWRTRRALATDGVQVQVEMPDLRHSEFNCTEVIDCAFADVQKKRRRDSCRSSDLLVGPVPASAHGSPQQIHQLITMLATSLADLECAENLAVEASFERKGMAPSSSPSRFCSVRVLATKACPVD